MSNNSQSHSSQSSSQDCTPDPNHDYTATQKELILLSILAWPHPLMITAASSHTSNTASMTWRTSPTILASVVTMHATTAPRMTTYHLKGACVKRATSSFSSAASGYNSTESFLKAVLNDDYDLELRFNSDDDIRQGQLRELLDILPNNLETFGSRKWFASAFMDGDGDNNQGGDN
ncbi:hypothetical protein C8J57DRAFT_1730259 [Mycena rebaudengoi]|nr:hypothetical protein C8J57DRAFT_1730259 [Mycena rebaudengoi]